MKHGCLILAVVLSPLSALAQTKYTPAVPAASMSTSYGGYYSQPGTAAGSAMNGMASVISAQGERNLSNSAAAVNYTQAESQYIKNRNEATNTYFEMRATNRAAQAAEASPRLTSQQLAQMAKDDAPKPLSASQVNPVSGKINWPGPLQGDDLNDERTEISMLMERQSRYGGLPYADQNKVRQNVSTMYTSLKKQVKEIPPQDYLGARKFLDSLVYAAAGTQL